MLSAIVDRHPNTVLLPDDRDPCSVSVEQTKTIKIETNETTAECH